MSLINCAECSKEISSSADSCPNCGHPVLKGPIRNDHVMVANEKEEPFPKWVIAPIAILGAIFLFTLIYVIQNSDRADRENINVDLASTQPVVERDVNLTVQPAESDSGTTIPYPSDIQTAPQENNQTVGADTRTTVIEETPGKARVELNAKVADPKGNITAVKAEKFYLLDKDLNEILREANLKPIQNQNLVNSFGLSVIYPDKFSDFNQKALSAINDHIKYDTLTDSNGVAQISNVNPDKYFLFGIHKVGKGFAVWSSRVAITEGNNKLNIQPQRTQELARL